MYHDRFDAPLDQEQGHSSLPIKHDALASHKNQRASFAASPAAWPPCYSAALCWRRSCRLLLWRKPASARLLQWPDGLGPDYIRGAHLSGQHLRHIHTLRHGRLRRGGERPARRSGPSPTSPCRRCAATLTALVPMERASPRWRRPPAAAPALFSPWDDTYLYIVTNQHVVDGATTLSVSFGGQRSL